MHYTYSILVLSIVCCCLSCQDSPVEPGSRGLEMSTTGNQSTNTSNMQMQVDALLPIAGVEVRADYEMMNAGSNYVGDMRQTMLDMFLVSDLGFAPPLDLDMIPSIDPEERDMLAPIEVPASCNGPLELPIPDCRPAPLPSTGDLYEDCVRRINQFRTECQCLPSLERWFEGENCADQHAEYDAMMNQAHSGFNTGICSPSGRGQNECPGYRSNDQVISLCLQQMWDEGPGEPFIEHGHYINMTNPSHYRVACGFFTTEQGQVWAIQNFSP
jgi:hypothetical protein